MENEERILKEAYRKVSDDVKHIITSSEWLRRIKEIGQKYSLTEAQIDALGYEVLFTFLNIQSADLLNETVEEELEVSSILAEQIVGEIEERIFAWAMKKLEQKNHAESENTLDVPPPNLPGEVVGEEIVESEKAGSVPTGSSYEPPILAREDVQQFFATPTPTTPVESTETKFESVPVQTNTSSVASTNQKPSFIAQKLTQPTQSVQNPPAEAPKKYTVDPYREPLE